MWEVKSTTQKKRLKKIERSVNPPDPSYIMAFRDDAGILRDAEGNIITGQLSGTVIIFDVDLRDL